MLIDEADLERLYLEIQSTALRDGGITVLILVAPDCDAICTCRMLTDLMRSDNIQYKIRPVSGYADIEAARDSFINQSEQLRSLVFINCGGRVNLDKMFNPTANGKRCFVFDHHRPIHLANIHAGRDVCVLNDGGIHLADIPEAGPDMDDAIYSDDDEDDFDDDFSDEEPAGESLMDDDRAASSASDSSPDSTGSGSRRKRKSPSSSPEDKGAPKHKKNMSAAQRRERRQGLRSYYMISTHGKPSSQTAFNMAIQLTKMNNALLWLAIVGASSHFISERINKGGYESLVATFHEEVKKHNPQSDDHGSMSSVEDAAVRFVAAFDPVVTAATAAAAVVVHNVFCPCLPACLLARTARRQCRSLLTKAGFRTKLITASCSCVIGRYTTLCIILTTSDRSCVSGPRSGSRIWSVSSPRYVRSAQRWVATWRAVLNADLCST